MKIEETTVVTPPLAGRKFNINVNGEELAVILAYVGACNPATAQAKLDRLGVTEKRRIALDMEIYQTLNRILDKEWS